MRPEQERDPADLDPGVLGRLPRSRPGKRSPRRDSAAARASATAAAAPPPAERPEDDRGILEEVARTGFGLAAGAAGLGFRVAGRALGALRDAGQRG